MYVCTSTIASKRRGSIHENRIAHWNKEIEAPINHALVHKHFLHDLLYLNDLLVC